MPPSVPNIPPRGRPTTPPVEGGGEWEVFAGRAGLTADELRVARRWWEATREPGEGAAAFLIRQGVLIKRAAKEIEMVRKGYMDLDDFRHLFAGDGRERIRRLATDTAHTDVVEVRKPPETAAAAATSPEPPAAAPIPAAAVAAVSPATDRGEPTIRLPRQVEVGQVLGKCLLTERVGEGGAGVVFRALHQGFNIPVAVKVLRVDPETRIDTRLGHEARLLARLNHPHIVRVWDFDEASDPPYLVLEWVDGLSLDELIRQSGRLAAGRAVRVAAQVAGALGEAHRLGVVHRDVKPGNILLTRDGAAKLADLGLAVAAQPRPAGGGGRRALDRAAVAGTVAYMAPELFDGHPPDLWSDMYGLGVTLYQALTGVLPFPGPTQMQYMIQHAEDRPVPPHEVVGDIPPGVSAVVMRTLEKDPAARFPTCQELADALAGVDAPEPRAVASAPTAVPATPGVTEATPAAPEPKRSLWRSLFGGRADGPDRGTGT